VGGEADERGPAASESSERGEVEVARAVKTGRKDIGSAEPFWAERGAESRGLEKKEKGRERGFGSFSFFKPFQTFKFKLFPKFKHFKPFFEIFQNNLQTFKTSHKQTIKPCIQIMMHKHLLLLNY
jgi:hypothetical protein